MTQLPQPREAPLEILERSLARCDAELAKHLDAAVQVLGRAALSVVDLPPLSDSAPDAAHLRVVAVLLWAREVEQAGLPGFVEALAEQFSRGRSLLDLGDSAAELMQYHRRSSERFGPDERRSIYSQLFGGEGSPTPNAAFPGLFSSYLQALTEIASSSSQQPLAHLNVRAGLAARALSGSLSSRGLGIAAFAARDVTANIRESLALLGNPDLARALGGRSVWMTIEMLAPQVLGRVVSPSAHLTRAQAAVELIAWLAQLGGNTPQLSPASPVVSAAVSWQSVPLDPLSLRQSA